MTAAGSTTILNNVGTTSTVLHGNAAGAPSFSAVSLSSEVSGNLSVSHLNGGSGASSSTYWRGDGSWAPVTAAKTNHVTRDATGNYTILTTDDVVVYEGTSGGINWVLPSAAAYGAGRVLYVFNNTTNPTTLSETFTANGSDQVMNSSIGGYASTGTATVVLAILVSDGVNKWLRQ